MWECKFSSLDLFTIIELSEKATSVLLGPSNLLKVSFSKHTIDLTTSDTVLYKCLMQIAHTLLFNICAIQHGRKSRKEK